MDQQFQDVYRTVMEYYGEYGRHHLPWRQRQTPYRVTVSEIMLQQTQADRVIPFFQTWMKTFPSWKALATAPQSEVLRLWKGLGYNSRALRLKKLATIVSNEYRGRLPRDYHRLQQLPGIGPYTAGAIRAFAWDVWTPLIETNVRRVFIYHFFHDQDAVSDKEILELMLEMYEAGYIESTRDWYEALMDYGAQLPKVVQHNPNIKSRHYTKQSRFEGSDRQIRGKILDFLLKDGEVSHTKLFSQLGPATEHARYQKILDTLSSEGFIKQTKKGLILAD